MKEVSALSHAAAHKALASVSEISHNAARQRKRIRERLQLEHSTLDNSRLRLDRATTPVKMKLNISYPANGSQKLIEIDDERKLRAFMEKRMGTEVPGDGLGDEFKGYVCLPFFSFFTLQSIGIRAIRILHPGFHGFWQDKGIKKGIVGWIRYGYENIST